MSGNFDFPPASGRGSRQDHSQEVPSIAARLQNLRNLLGSERYQSRDDYQPSLALETLDQELGELGPDQNPRRTERRRRRLARERERERELLREHNTFPSIAAQMEQDAGSNEPGSSTGRIRRRPAVSIPNEPLARFRDRGRNTSTDALNGLQWAAARLAETSSSVNALLDEPAFHAGSSGRGTVESQVNRWRAKRRKLDSDDKREGTQGFSYGHHGQVVPGALKMEIASCDGGTYSEPNGDSSWPENVLINDSSVYCTQSDRCNLVLRHQGETPFCLKKIVIRAPKAGFDAPIQEGMIFVSMTSDELLARTAQYQIQYSPSRRRARRCRMNRAHPSQEYFNSIRSPLQSLERTVLADPAHLSDSEMDSAFANARSSQINRRSSTSEFRVTTDFDDKSEDDEDDQESENEFPSAADIERLRMEQLDAGLLCPDEDDDTDDSESDGNIDEMTSAFNRGRLEMRRRMRAARILMGGEHDIEGRRRMVPSLIEPTGPPSAGGDSVGNPSSQATPEVMKPHARFFIEREKSMVSIKFDPPASGRFILIKLWSPYSGGNIDIQSIVAHGFAGPRFFPAMGFR